MKIYISGAITGLPFNEAKNNFEAMAAIIEHSGNEPINPFDVGLPEGEEHTWEEYMLADMPHLFAADAIYMLNNWQQSKGARIEKAIMEILDKPVFYQASSLPIQAQAMRSGN